MRRTSWRRSSWFGACLAVFLLPACGGGGAGGGGGATAPLALRGQIVTRNGSTHSLGGVQFSLRESGDTVTSKATGAFALDAPVGLVLHLEVKDPLAPSTSGHDGKDVTESEDDDDDAEDISGSEVEIGAIKDGESCDIELEIEDGKIVDVRMTKSDGEGSSHHCGEGLLLPPEGAELKAYGEIELELEDGCAQAELEVEGLPLGVFTIQLVNPAGETETVGEITIEKKEAHFRISACTGDVTLPFGVASLAELAGYTVNVVDADGAIVLTGTVPEAGAEDMKDKKDDDKDKDEDGDKGDDEKKDDDSGHDGSDDKKDGESKD